MPAEFNLTPDKEDTMWGTDGKRHLGRLPRRRISTHGLWSGTVLAGIAVFLTTATVFASPSLSAWGPAASLESMPGASADLNTPVTDGCPILSRDGLHLYMASNRPGGLGGLDIWVAERASLNEPFGAPVNAGAPVNSPDNDFCPSPLRDGHGFMFVSNRPGGCGGSDVYVTRDRNDSGWEMPQSLGCQVNSSADEAGPVPVFAEAGPPTLYFSSLRTGGLGGSDLYRSEMAGAWSFGTAESVPGVNSGAEDMQPSVSRDGRELVFASNRPGSQGFDIWSATRNSIHEPWAAPVNIGTNINSPANETRPSLSWEADVLLFGTTRPGFDGGSDIFYSLRQ